MDAPLSASPLGQMSRPAGVAGGLQGTTRATTLWHEQETRNSGQGASTSSDPGDKLPAPGTIIAHRFPCTSCNCNAWTWLAFLVPDDEEVDEYKSVIDPGYQRRYEDFLVRQLGPLETDEYDDEFYDRRSCRRSVHDNDYDFLDLRLVYKTKRSTESIAYFGSICSTYAEKLRGMRSQAELEKELAMLKAELELAEAQSAKLKQGLERVTGVKRKQRVTRAAAKELAEEKMKEPEDRLLLNKSEDWESMLNQRIEKLKQLTCRTFLYDPDSFSRIVKDGHHGFDHEQFAEARTLWESCGWSSSDGPKIYRNTIVNVKLAGAWTWGKMFMDPPVAGARALSDQIPLMFTQLEDVRSGMCFGRDKKELLWSLTRKERDIERVVLPVRVSEGEFECPICYAAITTDTPKPADQGADDNGACEVSKATVRAAVCCKRCNCFVACESCHARLFGPKRCPKCRALLDDSKLVVFAPRS